jgi:hypothetical protein
MTPKVTSKGAEGRRDSSPPTSRKRAEGGQIVEGVKGRELTPEVEDLDALADPSGRKVLVIAVKGSRADLRVWRRLAVKGWRLAVGGKGG